MTSSGVFSYPQIGLDLARRLERAEALASAAYIEARRALQPAFGAEWRKIAGTYAFLDGLASPLTQTFGLGIFEPVTTTALERIEAFFDGHGASTAHEVSSLATHETWQLLSARGYSPIETSTVLVRPTTGLLLAPTPGVRARAVEHVEQSTWCRVMAEGLGSESAELVAAVEGLAPVMARSDGACCFIAELEGVPVAAGLLTVHNGVALLGGASTIPAARRRGAQSALLRVRLEHAAKMGVDLAMMVATPGSASQRNGERQGFRPTYVRSKWQRDCTTTPAP